MFGNLLVLNGNKTMGYLYRETQCQGFTLIEILIALAISGIIMTGVYTTYMSQQKNYIIQNQIVDMHQGLRAVFYIMTKEIRMAGYDPQMTNNYKVIRASEDAFRFDADLNHDGGTPGSGESFLYEIYDGDKLRRTPKGSAVALNIEALSFAYAYGSNGDGGIEMDGGNIRWVTDSDGDGSWDRVDTNLDGYIDINDDVGGVGIGETVNVNTIRAVKVWLLAKTEKPDSSYKNTNTYVVGTKHLTFNDNLRRRLMIKTIYLRNMGV